MKLEQKGSNLIATQEPHDDRCYGVQNAAGESRLLHHIRRMLNANPGIVGLPGGTKFIKKRMYKDGHLMDDMQQYIRTTKKIEDNGYLCFYNSSWQIEGLEESMNRDGQCCLIGYWLLAVK